MNQTVAPDRARSFAFFVLAVIYFFLAQLVATHSANGLSSGEWSALVERTMLLFLLLVGYAGMGRAFEGQRRPIEAMGLSFRPGWQREFGLGAALGWGMLIASILPMVLLGGLIVTVWKSPQQFLMLCLDLLVLAVASLAEEVAFRGYPFQRLVEAIGPVLATLGFSVIFGVAHIFNPSANKASVIITIFAGWLLSAAYLRTRALWFCWGWHFAWNVSMGVIFGLPISGITRFSPVIQSNTVGPTWITGGDYGPEASGVAAIVILIGIVIVFRITRDYAYKYSRPVIAPVGVPANLDVPSASSAAHRGFAAQPQASPMPAETLVRLDSSLDPVAAAAENRGSQGESVEAPGVSSSAPPLPTPPAAPGPPPSNGSPNAEDHRPA